MRAFIAIEIPADIRKKINKFCGDIPGELSMVPESNLHITLQFLGDLSDRQAATVAGILKSVNVSQFQAEARGLGYFGGVRINVVYVKVDDRGATASLYSKIGAELNAKGIKFESDREYTPHITIARAKDGGSLGLKNFINRRSTNYLGAFKVNSISLKKSTLKGTTPTYSNIYSRKF